MITVFRKDFIYRFDGKTGKLTHEPSGMVLELSKETTEACNKSNKGIDQIIKRFNQINNYLASWEYDENVVKKYGK